jgi:hypothetical protein
MHLRFKLAGRNGGSATPQVPIEIRQLDYKLVRRILSNQPIELDPGSYIVQEMLPGGEPHVWRVVIGENEERTDVDLVFEDEPELLPREQTLATLLSALDVNLALNAASPKQNGLEPISVQLSWARDANVQSFQVSRKFDVRLRAFVWNALDWKPKPIPFESCIQGGHQIDREQVELKLKRSADILQFICAGRAPLNVRIPSFGDRSASLRVRMNETGPILSLRLDHNEAELLLEYMSQGAWAAVATSLTASWVADILLQKTPENPLAAFVGAYALLQVGELEKMHGWTRRLCESFPHLADGAAIHGEYLARLGRHEEALGFFLHVWHRGLPVFFAGLNYTFARLSAYARFGGKDADHFFGGRKRDIRTSLDMLVPFVLFADKKQFLLSYSGVDPARPSDKIDMNNITPQVEAWILKETSWLSPFVVRLSGDRTGFGAFVRGHWVVVVDALGFPKRVGRILFIHAGLESFTLYFDKLHPLRNAGSLADIGLTLPTGLVARLRPEDLSNVLGRDGIASSADVPLIQDAAYVRDLLELTTRGDLLGPANGPEELVIDMSVRDRYLVGKLAPRAPGHAKMNKELEPSAAVDEEDDSAQESAALIHEPGAEFNRASGRVEPEDDALDEIDTTNNQSLVPSSMGLTFCVGLDVKALDVTACWGSYGRVPKEEHDYTRPRKNRETGEVDETKVKVWRRQPRGGRVTLTLKDGPIAPLAPDSEQVDVRIQGAVRTNAKGERLVTLFLVNDQREPETNRDSAWLFQPELSVKGSAEAADTPVFLRRPSNDVVVDDPERDHLELIYRRRVEFAVGHGVAVRAVTPKNDPTRAIEVRTEVIPSYEVPVTETPGLDPNDRPAMKKMVERGWLDMLSLADLDKAELEEALKTLVDDYAAWIVEQRARVGKEITGYDAPANEALDRCKTTLQRLLGGLKVLLADPKALEAFRFANRAMARQRARGIFSLKRRRGEELIFADVDVRKNRSWRPFQLAFLLLSIPSLADPLHPDRTNPAEAFADLLWFPTGGGKTEAYLGVAAFAMAVRRLQGVVENLDGGRGLTVIMRYTLRLLTLQQFQRATTLLCAMEVIRAADVSKWGAEPFTLGLWVGNKVTPGTTEASHKAIEYIRDKDRNRAGIASPAQLTSCPWCGSEIQPGRDIEVDKTAGRTVIYCGDKLSQCEFSKAQSHTYAHPGLPVKVVDEEIYHRPPTMMIATVDKFAMLAWRADARTLFGRANGECERHGLLWPGHNCGTGHKARKPHPAAKVKPVRGVRPPDLIIQDEFHLISGPLGTMVGLYETAVDDLCSWQIGKTEVRPKIVASTATVRRAGDQVRNVFMRRLAIFPPKALDVEDDFFSVQRSVDSKPGRRYLGICSPGSSRPAVLIRTYTAFLTAAQGLFDAFGSVADPYMTMVGYFNSLRELGGMKRLAEDDVQTRSYRVKMSLVQRPGLEQRSVSTIAELTSRVSNTDIPKYLDQMEVPFDGAFDPAKDKFVIQRTPGAPWPIDVVLATNMLSVGVDVNRLGVMVVNGQPKGTAEYIQATSRVGRAFPGIVAAVLTWARPRDLSHYETFEHYHATFYQHVEAQSVTPFSPRAMDRGLTGAMLAMMRNRFEPFAPNAGAGALSSPSRSEMVSTVESVTKRTWEVTEDSTKKNLATAEMKSRADEWAKEAAVPGRVLVYQKYGAGPTAYALLETPGIKPWSMWTVPMSMREVEPGVNLVMEDDRSNQDPAWRARPLPDDAATAEQIGEESP